jgi:hypothetical protein
MRVYFFAEPGFVRFRSISAVTVSGSMYAMVASISFLKEPVTHVVFTCHQSLAAVASNVSGIIVLGYTCKRLAFGV